MNDLRFCDNERSRLSGIGSRGVSRMSSKIVQCHVLEAKHMNSDYEWILN